MNPSWTIVEFARAAATVHADFSDVVSWDAVSRWLEPAGLHNSLVAQEILTVLTFLLVFCVLLVFSVAILVSIGAKREAHAARWQIALRDTPIAHVMVTDFRSLSPSDLLKDAVENALKSLQQHFLVVDGQHATGVISRSELFASLELRAPETALTEIVGPAPGEVSPSDTLGVALRRFQNTHESILAVVESGKLIGLVTQESLRDYVRAQTALHSISRNAALCAEICPLAG